MAIFIVSPLELVVSELFNQIIFKIQENDLHIRRNDKRFFSYHKVHPPVEGVMDLIEKAGFAGVLGCKWREIDHGLITALVERWRPKTNTLLMPIGEVTVTFQDVQAIWGLRTNGPAVTGKDPGYKYSPDLLNKFERLVGFRPAYDDFKFSQVKWKCFTDFIIAAPPPQNDRECEQRARIYIFILLSGGTLFTDSSDSVVQLYFLDFIEDLDMCGRYSWGSAVLASLYRNLDKATGKDATELCGPIGLLQLWAWSRFSLLSPTLSNRDTSLLHGKTFGCRWSQKLSFTRTTKSNLVSYRSSLEALRSEEFIWAPHNNYLHLLASGIVEQYFPNRVMRQFNLFQEIPNRLFSRANEHIWLRKNSRRGAEKGWGSVLKQFVAHWNNPHMKVITADLTDTPTTSHDNRAWYYQRTVIHIKNPAFGPDNLRGHNLRGYLNFAVDGLTHLQQMMQPLVGQEVCRPLLGNILQMSHSVLQTAHADERPINWNSLVSQDHHQPFDTQLTEEQRRGIPRWMRRGSRNSQQTETGHVGTSNQDDTGGASASQQMEMGYIPTFNFEQGNSSMHYQNENSSMTYNENFLNIGGIPQNNEFPNWGFNTPYAAAPPLFSQAD